MVVSRPSLLNLSQLSLLLDFLRRVLPWSRYPRTGPHPLLAPRVVPAMNMNRAPPRRLQNMQGLSMLQRMLEEQDRHVEARHRYISPLMSVLQNLRRTQPTL